MDLDFVLRAGQFAFTALVGLYTLATARRSSTKAEADQLTDRLSSQDNRILTLEQQMLHLPDSQQLSELAGDMKAIKAYVVGKDLRELSLYIAPMTDDEKKIVKAGCLINYNRNR